MYYLFEKSDTLNTPVECFVVNAMQGKFPVLPHWHYFAEMIYILEGEAEMHDDGKSYILSEGELIIFHPKSVHSIYLINNMPLRYAVLKFDINKFNMTSAHTPKLRSIFKSARKKSMNVYFDAESTEKMECGRLFLSCIDEMKNHEYGYDLVISSNIYKLLMNIVRSWLDSGFSIDNDVFSADNEYDIDGITEYIDLKMQDNLHVSEIAKKCGMSYSYFAKKFHSVYGMSCKEYIEIMRIFKVEEFLLFTDFDLSYICQETGFSDCSHMIKSFKKYRGITPKQFRLKNERRGQLSR